MMTVASNGRKLETRDRLRQIEMDGFCVLEDVIPADVVGDVRESVVAAQEAKREEAAADQEKTRAQGHRIGNPGVASMRQVLNETQGAAPYLADSRLMEIVSALFGPWPRISCTDVVINTCGCSRGYWHADWPYNHTNASNLPAPYPDAVMHLSTIWMLSEFTAENGGTLVIPGSHRTLDNPASGEMDGVDQDAPWPTEMPVTGSAGSVFIADSRLWHAVAANVSDADRVALLIRYAPWWLNLNPTMIGAPEHTMMVAETGGKNYEQPLLRRDVFAALPKDVKPLYRHWVEEEG